MGVLIEELGLGQVLNTNVSELTASEAQRLSVACHLMSDAEIIMLDRPTVTMDIFDTFFLVEFLRQWAAGAPSKYLYSLYNNYMNKNYYYFSWCKSTYCNGHLAATDI